jgi:hypothetical protein
VCALECQYFAPHFMTCSKVEYFSLLNKGAIDDYIYIQKEVQRSKNGGGGGIGDLYCENIMLYNVCSYKKYVYASWKIYIVKTGVMKVVDYCFHSMSSLLYA